MIIVDCEQNSEQWFKEKLGKPSASNASRIITNSGEPSKQKTAYLYELASEIITGKNTESYTNGIMQAGLEREDESRKYYELIKRVKVKQVGVVYKDDKKLFLCSPDGIVRNNWGVELKNVLPKTQVKYLLENKLPEDYSSQVQFSLYVTGFKFWDFLSYVPNMKPLLIKVKRNEKFISLLQAELKKFCDELKNIIKKIK